MASYTAEQIERLQTLPEAIATAIILVDYSNPAFADKEFEVGMSFIGRASGLYAENSLIRAAANYVNAQHHHHFKPDFTKVTHRKEAGTLLQTYEQQIDEGIGLLAKDEEAAVFGGFLLDLAHEVAEAEGVSAQGRTPISMAEQGFIHMLKYRLAPQG